MAATAFAEHLPRIIPVCGHATRYMWARWDIASVIGLENNDTCAASREQCAEIWPCIIECANISHTLTSDAKERKKLTVGSR